MIILRQAILTSLIIGFVAVSATSSVSANTKTSAQARDAKSFVMLGYGDFFNRSFRSLNFTTEELNTEDTQVVVRLVKSYNAFSGEDVAKALHQFKGRISSYEFGREGSPVLYVNIPYWTHQRENANSRSTGTRIDDAEFIRLKDELQKVFVDQLHADEFNVDQIRSRTIRIWWD